MNTDTTHADTDKQFDDVRRQIYDAVVARCKEMADEPEQPADNPNGKYFFAKVWVKGHAEPITYFHGRREIVDQAIAHIKNKQRVVTGRTDTPNAV